MLAACHVQRDHSYQHYVALGNLAYIYRLASVSFSQIWLPFSRYAVELLHNKLAPWIRPVS